MSNEPKETLTLSGTLSVQRISGAYGEFSVANLKCAIGVLHVKDPQLDQFKSGQYQGDFVIRRIYPQGAVTRNGCIIVKIMVIVDEYIIHNDEPDSLDSDVALKDQDPLEPELASAPEVDLKVPPKDSQIVVKALILAPVSNDDGDNGSKPEVGAAGAFEELFGKVWPLGDVVKLDPTSIRSEPVKHRARLTYLDQHGYEFKARTQSWVKVGPAESEDVIL